MPRSLYADNSVWPNDGGVHRLGIDVEPVARSHLESFIPNDECDASFEAIDDLVVTMTVGAIGGVWSVGPLVGTKSFRGEDAIDLRSICITRTPGKDGSHAVNLVPPLSATQGER